MTRYSPRTGLPTTYQAGPFISSHIYVQWGGKLPGQEQWSCGFRMWKPTGFAIEADGATLMPAVSAAISAFHTRPGSQIIATALLSYCKVNAIGADGRYVGAGTNEHIFADLGGGINPSVGVTYPNQIALAVSLLTGFSRGPAHRGRFFLPIPGMPTDFDGTISAAAQDSVHTSVNTLLTAVNAGHEEKMVVMSRKAGAPAVRPVTGFSIGAVLDTQRRRRRSLPEHYA
jgi:hypothetical protein